MPAVSTAAVGRAVVELNDLAGFREKGDRHHLCEAPSGPFRQMVPVTFFPPKIVQGHLAKLYLKLTAIRSLEDGLHESHLDGLAECRFEQGLVPSR